MRERPSPEELQGHLLDAVASCWINLHGTKEGIVSDTFQDIFAELKGRALSWAGLGALTLIDTNWSDEEMWNLLRSRFGAVENPLGVLNFADDQVTAAAQRRDHLIQFFPRMIETVEGVIKKTLSSVLS